MRQSGWGGDRVSPRDDITVTIRAVDRATPGLRRARWHFLRPINHGLPPRGSMAWQSLELHVALRRLGRELVKGIPGASAVPWAEIGATWGRGLDRIGTVYLVVVAVIVVVWLLGEAIG